MSWAHEVTATGEMHFGMFIPEFGDGLRGMAYGQYDGGPLRSGHIAVVDAEGEFVGGRPSSEVVGWRVTCQCHWPTCQRTAFPPRDAVWVSDQVWARVASPSQHDPESFRVYMPDSEREFLAGHFNQTPIGPIGQALWLRTHVAFFDAAATLEARATAVRSANDELFDAVMDARNAGLSWANVGSALGVTAQAAQKRWAKAIRDYEENVVMIPSQSDE